jgi:hypothetical protein
MYSAETLKHWNETVFHPAHAKSDEADIAEIVTAAQEDAMRKWVDETIAEMDAMYNLVAEQEMFFWYSAPQDLPAYPKCEDCGVIAKDVESRYDEPERCEACHKAVMLKKLAERAGT